MKNLRFLCLVAPIFAFSSYCVVQAATVSSVASSLSVSTQKAADALSRFAALQNREVGRTALTHALQPFSRPLTTPTTAQMQSAASSLKLSLQTVSSLAQIRERGGAALLRLQAPDEWIVLGGVGSKRSILQSEGSAQIVENSAIESRFAGALMLTDAGESTSRVLVVEPVQTARVTTIGEALRVRVPIRNRGTLPLRLQVLHTSCSCTSDDNSTRILAPGQSGELSFKIEAREEGTRTVSVLIGTDDVLAPRLPLVFQIITPQVPTPPTVFLSGDKGQTIRSTFDLKLPENSVVESISSTRKEISTRLLPRNSNGVQRIEIVVSESAPAGQFSDVLQIALSGGEVQKLVVSIDGYVNDDIRVSPRLLDLGEIRIRDVVRRTILLQAPQNQPFAVQSIRVEKPFARAKTDFGVVGTSHVVEIEVQANGVSSLQNRLTLELSGDRELDIDMTGNAVAATLSRPAALQVGQRAPDFSIVDANGTLQKLSDRRGRKNVLLTFFPRCFTGGCTAQNLSLRDEYSNFVQSDTDILAVSVDDARTQRAFATKYELPFALIPDTSRALSVAYGAAQSANDATSLRQSVLIDKDGVVRWIDRDVQVATHGADVLRQMRILSMEKSTSSTR